MAEEPGKCRYIMGILEKNKKSKGTAFVYDENNDYYKMEINGIDFDGGKNSVNIEINDHNQVIIGIDIVIDYGLNVGKVVSEIQNEVVNAIDRYIGFRNVKVNVNVNKIKF